MKPELLWKKGLSGSEILADPRVLYDFVQKRKGYVYVMSHPDRGDALKVGRTAKNPFVRAKTLGTAGILGEFTPLWLCQFANSAWAEVVLHAELSKYRYDKEFFRIDIDTIKEHIAVLLERECYLLRYLERSNLLEDDFEAWLNLLDVDSLIY